MLARFSRASSKFLTRPTIRLLSTSSNAAHSTSASPKIVQVSSEEKDAGVLTWKNLELANRALHHDGLVVLENAIEHSKLDFLNEKMVVDARTLQAAKDSPYNYNRGSALLPQSQPSHC